MRARHYIKAKEPSQEDPILSFPQQTIQKGTILLILALAQMGLGRATKKPKRIPGASEQAAKVLTERIKSASPENLEKAQAAAAQKLESNVARALTAMTGKKAKGIPPEVQESGKKILSAIQAGQLSDAMQQSLPEIMLKVSAKTGPALQLKTILERITPRAPLDLKGPLEGLSTFLKANLNGVNNLLIRIVNGVPNLTQGVVSSLANTLGGVGALVGGTLDSLNGLVGGLLSGGLLSGSGSGGGLLG